MCSVGILSDCDCSKTSFDEADLNDYSPILESTQLTASLNGPSVTT